MRVLKTLALSTALAMAAQPTLAQSNYDARSPAQVAAMISGSGIGARAELQTGSQDPTVFGTWEGLNFAVKFFNCNPARDRCDVALFVGSWDTEDLTLPLLNNWNDYTFMCPAYMDTPDSAIMWMGTMAHASQTRAEAVEQFTFFTQCIREFEAFLADPQGYNKEEAGNAALP